MRQHSRESWEVSDRQLPDELPSTDNQKKWVLTLELLQHSIRSVLQQNIAPSYEPEIRRVSQLIANQLRCVGQTTDDTCRDAWIKISQSCWEQATVIPVLNGALEQIGYMYDVRGSVDDILQEETLKAN